MTVRQRAHATLTAAFIGFLALMFLWGHRGGNNSGSNIIAFTAFAWVFALSIWLNITLRCPRCAHRIHAEQDLMLPVPERCDSCGLDLVRPEADVRAR
jgi:hypothetical protein